MATVYRTLDQSPPDVPASGTSPGLLDRLIARVPRPVRFGLVGGACAALQLLLLGVLARAGIELHGANVLAFVLSTQVNFALSSAFTWRDRRIAGWHPRSGARRLAGYNLLALGSLLINQATFALALPHAHYLVAAACGILAGMVLTYAVSGRILFRPRPVLPDDRRGALAA